MVSAVKFNVPLSELIQLPRISEGKVQVPSVITETKNVISSYPGPDNRLLNRVISVISIAPRETTLTISDSIEAGSPVETEEVRVISLGTTEITEITRFFKNRPSGSDSLNAENRSATYGPYWHIESETKRLVPPSLCPDASRKPRHPMKIMLHKYKDLSHAM